MCVCVYSLLFGFDISLFHYNIGQTSSLLNYIFQETQQITTSIKFHEVSSTCAFKFKK